MIKKECIKCKYWVRYFNSNKCYCKKKDIVINDTFLILFKDFDGLSEFFFYA